MNLQVVDPAVSRAKFDAEIAAFRSAAALHQRRGWWLVDWDFPEAFVVLAAPQLQPAPVVCGVRFNYANYDLEPPSVQLVNPFSREPYRYEALPVQLLRRSVQRLELAPGHFIEQQVPVPMMQPNGPGDLPFLCIPGVREYHSHPAHSGDAWFLHRSTGEGTMYSILNAIHQYGVQPIAQYQIGIRVSGFALKEVPE